MGQFPGYVGVIEQPDTAPALWVLVPMTALASYELYEAFGAFQSTESDAADSLDDDESAGLEVNVAASPAGVSLFGRF